MKNKRGRGYWWTPILLALPIGAAAAAAFLRYGETLRSLIQLAVKLGVTR